MSRNALYIQSGGPTSVINASAYGVIRECMEHPQEIGKLYAARFGTVGVLNDQLIDLALLDANELALLPKTPSMAFGSCRYRMMDFEQDDRDYQRYLEVLQKHDIGHLFLNGGNGTLASAIKLGRYMQQKAYDCRVMVIPKTVDNDIECIDHSPGFPSSARHVALTVSELAHDVHSYDTGLITVAEVMGRNTGWLAAASLAAHVCGRGPDLIYVPERQFCLTQFLSDVRQVYLRKGKCFVVVAEGVKDEDGRYLFDSARQHAGSPDLNMGGAALCLAGYLRKHFDCKVRAVDLGLMQRCAIHTAADMDLKEAICLGQRAVQEAMRGVSGMMVSVQRQGGNPFPFADTLVPLEQAEQGGHPLPLDYVTENGCFIRESFLEYLLPLIGELPRYARLNL